MTKRHVFEWSPMNKESIEVALMGLNDMIELCNSICSMQKDKQWE